MDLTHWNLIDNFSLWEAACLAAGVDPKLSNDLTSHQEAKAGLIRQELKKAYDLAVSHVSFELNAKHRFEQDMSLEILFPPDVEILPSVQLIEELKWCFGSDRAFDTKLLFSDDDDAQPAPVFSRKLLENWFRSKGFKPVYSFVPEIKKDEALRELDMSSEGSKAPSNLLGTIGRREYRCEIILAIIAALDFDSLRIPDGGKAKIKKACLTRPRLFTKDSFDHAWKAGLAAGLFRMENHEKYAAK